MARLQSLSEDERFTLFDVSWETYERLLADRRDLTAWHFTYDDGVLDMVRPSVTRGRTTCALVTLVGTIAEELALDLKRAGSSTFKRADLRRGFNADSSFYIQHARDMAGRDEINLPDDPPPDLVVDMDVNDPSTDLLAICASFGIPELWRYEAVEERVTILRLRNGQYRAVIESAVLQPLTSDVLTQCLRASRAGRHTDWLRDLRAWIRNYD